MKSAANRGRFNKASKLKTGCVLTHLRIKSARDGLPPPRPEKSGGKMKPSERCIFKVAFCCAALMLVLASGVGTRAQSGSYPMEVISANHQDVSPPLKDVSPLAPDGAVQGNTSKAVSTSAGLNFEGLGQGEYGFTPNAAPPDTNASVGSTQVVEWVNESFAVFNK